MSLRGSYKASQAFQFHLVRLKGIRQVDEPRRGVFQFHLVRLKVKISSTLSGSIEISIPFSTIKSRTRKRDGRNIHISIPFSTIKSLRGFLVVVLGIVFQFHLVRLKARQG